jgi:hypothetical protein
MSWWIGGHFTLRHSSALLCEQFDEWSIGKIYLNMNPAFQPKT